MRRTSICVLVTFTFFPLLLAVAPDGDGEADERLLGSRVSLRDAVRWSQWIVAARGLDMGRPTRVSAGRLHYEGIKLKVVKSLKGDASPAISRVYLTRVIDPKWVESMPIQDEEYLFFLDVTLRRQSEVIKVLRATDENLRAILEALKALDEHLPGSQLSIPNAIHLSEWVVRARVVDMGGPTPQEDPGKRCYDHVTLKVVKFVLRRVEAPDAAPAEFPAVRVPLDVRPGAEEVVPEKDQEYLFFLDELLPGLNEAVKVLRATDENTRATLEARRRFGR